LAATVLTITPGLDTALVVRTATIWFILLISATRPLVELLRRPAVMKMLDRITGGIFIAFGPSCTGIERALGLTPYL